MIIRLFEKDHWVFVWFTSHDISKACKLFKHRLEAKASQRWE